MVRLFTHGGGAVSKKDQTHFPDGESRRQKDQTQFPDGGGKRSKKNQTDFPP